MGPIGLKRLFLFIANIKWTILLMVKAIIFAGKKELEKRPF